MILSMVCPMIRIFVFLCLVMTSATAFAAEKRQAGNVVYSPPKDWRVGSVQKQGWVTLRNKRKDKRCARCYIYIHIGTPAKGSFKAWIPSQENPPRQKAGTGSHVCPAYQRSC